MHLLQLNDDCLDAIFANLKMEDLLPLYTEIDIRFDEAIERQLHRFRDLVFTMREPPVFNENLMTLLGRQLKSLHINVGYSTQEKKVLQYLNPLLQGASETRRLRALMLDHTKWSNDILAAVEKVIPSLVFLDLRHCDVGDDQITQLLESADNLRALALFHINHQTRDSYLQAQILNRMPSLTLVHITMLGSLPFPLWDLSQQCPKISFFVRNLITNEVEAYGPPANFDSFQYGPWTRGELYHLP
ncbi:hypothetical protein KR074_010410 [Drosophila pseudoananassae]|nr:hypothetical protein KR074_010410 [Drosophila pseudoananassae]